MIRPNLKDDQCLSPQRLFIVMCVLLRELLRGGPAQFDNSIKLLFQLKDVTAKHRFFFFFIKTSLKNPTVNVRHYMQKSTQISAPPPALKVYCFSHLCVKNNIDMNNIHM